MELHREFQLIVQLSAAVFSEKTSKSHCALPAQHQMADSLRLVGEHGGHDGLFKAGSRSACLCDDVFFISHQDCFRSPMSKSAT